MPISSRPPTDGRQALTGLLLRLITDDSGGQCRLLVHRRWLIALRLRRGVLHERRSRAWGTRRRTARWAGTWRSAHRALVPRHLGVRSQEAGSEVGGNLLHAQLDAGLNTFVHLFVDGLDLLLLILLFLLLLQGCV